MAEKRLVILKRANKLFRQGKTDAAVKEYKKILAIKADDLEVRRIVGDLQLRQNNISEAIEQFDWIAGYYLKEGFFAKAIAMYKRITRVDPNYENALFKLADLYTKQGLVIEAKQIYLDMAEECKRKNDQKKALGMYKKILEFDRHNIKMRNLLADNYLKEGMENEAIEQYLTSTDILMNKKDYRKTEELLLKILQKIKNPKIIEKLLYCYTSQEEDDKAINLLKNYGDGLFHNLNLLKTLGELYLKKNLMNEAENIFIKITEIDPEEAEVIMKLGKVYLQREEYDKTYELFLPIVEKNIKKSKFEEAASLLRFIIASNNSYLPALSKLASVFKLGGKKNNLIALYESLIPVYENKGMKEQLKGILEELIQLSDTPFTYEEQLEKLTGKVKKEKEEEEDDVERESEFVSFNLRMVEDALKLSDFEKAIETLIKSKTTFPQNIEIRLKLFSVYESTDRIDAAVEEGKELLDIYKSMGIHEEYSELFDKLSLLKPEDEKLVEISGGEKTNIEIDFQKEELAEEMEAISTSGISGEVKVEEESRGDEDLIVLSEEQSVEDSKALKEKEFSKSLSTYISELDFYINEHYFVEAEKLIEELGKNYTGNKELLARIGKLKKAKIAETELLEAEPLTLLDSEADKFIEITAREQTPMPGFEDSNIEIDFEETGEPMELKLEDEELPGPEEIPFDVDIDETPGFKTPEQPIKFEIESSITEESHTVQESEDSKVGLKVEEIEPPEQIKVKEEEFTDIDEEDFLIEYDEPDKKEDLPMFEIDKDQLIQSPTVDRKEESTASPVISGIEDLDLDNIIMTEKEGPAVDSESPFEEITGQDLAFESEEDLLKDEPLFFDEAYYEIEKNVEAEQEAFLFWLKEVEKQRTSTIEKNMMEIFDEFKKGVDEKIGKEDHDTRYNLGIAYKEMGLLEEAIHEFFISSKHPLKFFDSAGLLGICFREKGMFSEAISWFEKAVETPKRKKEEYLAVKFELVVTHKLQEGFHNAKKIAEDIIQIDPNYRNITEIYEEIKKSIT